MFPCWCGKDFGYHHFIEAFTHFFELKQKVGGPYRFYNHIELGLVGIAQEASHYIIGLWGNVVEGKIPFTVGNDPKGGSLNDYRSSLEWQEALVIEYTTLSVPLFCAKIKRQEHKNSGNKRFPNMSIFFYKNNRLKGKQQEFCLTFMKKN